MSAGHTAVSAQAFVPLLAALSEGSEAADAVRVSAPELLAKASALSGPEAPRGRRARSGLGSFLRVGAPVAGGPPGALPPVFDSRLWYRAAHEPYEIADQQDCASCVFIASASAAQVRAAVQELEGDGESAAAVWRRLLSASDGEETDRFRAAAAAFCQEMAARAEQGAKAAARTGPAVPPLDWERFVCCRAACAPEDGEAAARRASGCYHHQDGDPNEAAFSCKQHVEGVVPHHFIQWVASEAGFHRRGAAEGEGPVIPALKPERSGASPPFALTDALHVAAVDQRAAGQVGDQVRRIKLSLMAHGPVIAMMRIDGDSFDVWGSGQHHHRAGRQKGGEGEGEPASGAKPSAEQDGDDGSGEQASSASSPPPHAEQELLRPVYKRRTPIVMQQLSRAGASSRAGEADEAGEADQKAAAKRRAARRLGYRLPGRDRFDEYHEVMVVGWGLDDAGRPCWIIQNSYGEQAGCHCAVDAGEGRMASEEAGEEAGEEELPEPWLRGPLARLRQAYAACGLTSKRGCVFVEMVNAELVESGRNTDLENNVIAFVPELDRGVLGQYRSGRMQRSWAAAGSSRIVAPKTDAGMLAGPGLWIMLLIAAFMLLALRYRRAPLHALTGGAAGQLASSATPRP